mmetsp:Transcript_70511/g.86515  ORF Transcript_70511/g.86515 Transcript_70511/m.86515 type:complete len:195 (-) Transcript_70511:138-722(-)
MEDHHFDFVFDAINESQDNDCLSIDAENTEILFSVLLTQFYFKANTNYVPFLMHGNLMENDTYDDIKTNDDIKIKKQKHNIKQYPQKHKETKKYVEQQKFVEPVPNIVPVYPQQLSYTHIQTYNPGFTLPQKPINYQPFCTVHSLTNARPPVTIVAPFTFLYPEPKKVQKKNEQTPTYPIHLAAHYWFMNQRKT